MENFPSNSHEPRAEPKKEPEEKKILKIVDGDVVRRKKPLSTRFREVFVGEDSQSVFDYVVFEVLIPAAKDMFVDAAIEGVQRRVYGGSRPSGRRPLGRPSAFGNSGNHTNYSRYSSNAAREEPNRISSRARRTHDFDEIIFPTRVEAEKVIDELEDLIEQYDFVSVSNLYELVGVEFHHTDEKWGWTSMRGASVRRVSNGYLLNLPKTEPLN